MTPTPTAPIGRQVTPGTADKHLLSYITSHPFERVFLVTGHQSFSFFENRGFIDRVSDLADTKRWSGARPNPEFSNLQEGLEVISGNHPDILIGVGGGSVLDMAKLLAVMYSRDPADVDAITNGTLDLSTRRVHLVLIPTTAGSGAEATHFSVLYRDSIKYSIAGQGLLPDQIFLDPFLVTGGKPEQLAASGLDALCQCVESIWAKSATEQSKKYAIEGVATIASGLVDFVHGDTQLASGIQWASHLGGHAINTSKTTAPHALSYFLTTYLGVPHGISVASTVGYFIEHHHKELEAGNPSYEKLGQALQAIRKNLGLRDGDSAIDYFELLFEKLGLAQPRSYWPENRDEVYEWVATANPGRLENHPVSLDKKALLQILQGL